jgi:hypothetical protein
MKAVCVSRDPPTLTLIIPNSPAPSAPASHHSQRDKSVENITSWYMFSLGAYRGLYLLNWIYRYFTEPHYSAWILWLSGLLQTLLYADFFYYFLRAKYYGKSNVVLPS